jgi:multidrug resistance efflux pump
VAAGDLVVRFDPTEFERQIKAGDAEHAEKIASTISLATRDAAIRTLEERDMNRRQASVK